MNTRPGVAGTRFGRAVDELVAAWHALPALEQSRIGLELALTLAGHRIRIVRPSPSVRRSVAAEAAPAVDEVAA